MAAQKKQTLGRSPLAGLGREPARARTLACALASEHSSHQAWMRALVAHCAWPLGRAAQRLGSQFLTARGGG
eukprot:6464153-Pyramimonas_sp.AAC.1